MDVFFKNCTHLACRPRMYYKCKLQILRRGENVNKKTVLSKFKEKIEVLGHFTPLKPKLF